jgi:CBS-domain-containing membrane protein
MGLIKKDADVRPRTDFDRLTVAGFMEGNVQAARPETMANQIAAMMLEGFGAVPIVDGTKRLVGIVTEDDLLGSLTKGQKWGDCLTKAADPKSLRVADLMEDAVVTCALHTAHKSSCKTGQLS